MNKFPGYNNKELKRKKKSKHFRNWCCPNCYENDSSIIEVLRPGWGYCSACGWEGLIEDSGKD